MVFSVILKYYQLDFTTPGSLPSEARFRKQMRQIPNFLKNPLGLPQMGQRLYRLTLNLGSLIAFTLRAFLAKFTSLFKLTLED
jgi:hypothetical protein